MIVVCGCFENEHLKMDGSSTADGVKELEPELLSWEAHTRDIFQQRLYDFAKRSKTDKLLIPAVNTISSKDLAVYTFWLEPDVEVFDTGCSSPVAKHFLQCVFPLDCSAVYLTKLLLCEICIKTHRDDLFLNIIRKPKKKKCKSFCSAYFLWSTQCHCFGWYGQHHVPGVINFHYFCFKVIFAFRVWFSFCMDQ